MYDKYFMENVQHTITEDEQLFLDLPDKFQVGPNTWIDTLFIFPSHRNKVKVTVEDILGAENMEVRRQLIQWYGIERFLRDGGAVEVAAPRTNEDNQTVRVLEITLGSEKTRYVEFTDPYPEVSAQRMTPEERVANGLLPDGRKRYYARYEMDVHGRMMADVSASTFAFDDGFFRPDVET